MQSSTIISSIFVVTYFIDTCHGRRIYSASNPAKPSKAYSGDVAFYEQPKDWFDCSTAGIGCQHLNYRGVACTVLGPSGLEVEKVEHLDPLLAELESALAIGANTKEVASNIAKEAKAAYINVDVLLQEFRKAEAVEPPVEVEAVAIATVRTHLQTIHVNTIAAEEKLQTMISQTREKREDALIKFRMAKSNIRARLAASLQPWIKTSLIVEKNKAGVAYDETPDLYTDISEAEMSLLTQLGELHRSLTPALKMQGQEDSRQIMQKLEPALGGSSGFMSSTVGLVTEFEHYRDRWRYAYDETIRGVADERRHASGHFAPYGRVPEGPFRFFEVNPEITRNFLDVEVPQVFLGLSPCLDCQSKMSAVPDLTLKYFTGVSAVNNSKAYVCMRAASKCLQQKVVCGCYGLQSSSSPTLLTRAETPDAFRDGGHTKMGCTHMIFRETPRPSTNIGVSSVAPTDTCATRDDRIRGEFSSKFPGKSLASPFRICFVTWNLGSERTHTISFGAGVGWGGVEGQELRREIGSMLEECSSEHNIVALAFQEGSDASIANILGEVVQSKFGADWTVHANVYAGGNDEVPRDREYKGYNATHGETYSWFHELPLNTPFVQGAFLAVVARKSLTPAVRSFGLDFKGKSAFSMFKNAARNALGSSGDKGTAIAQVRFDHEGQERTICLAGSHLDASSESKRADQSGKTMQALSIIGCPDGVWWGGDFNPRLEKTGPGQMCCPWDRLELLMHHGQKDTLMDVLKTIDPIRQGSSWRKDRDEDTVLAAPFTMKDWQCQGKQCTAGWHELPIGFGPTFHKLYDRAARKESEGTCHFQPHSVPKVTLNNPEGPVPTERLGEELTRINEENSAIISSWKTKAPGKCPDSGGREEMCWDGEYNMNGCKGKGYCHHVHNAGHCPLYTDRVLYASQITENGPDFLDLAPKSTYPIVFGCRYESLPYISSADHSPVIAQYTVTFGEKL